MVPTLNCLFCGSFLFVISAMPFLIRYIHGNTASAGNMNTKFREFWTKYVESNNNNNNKQDNNIDAAHNTNTPTRVRAVISKRQLQTKIQTISSRSYNADLGRMCYTVNDDVIGKYNITNIRLGGGLPELESDVPMREERTLIEEEEEAGAKHVVGEVDEGESMEINWWRSVGISSPEFIRVLSFYP